GIQDGPGAHGACRRLSFRLARGGPGAGLRRRRSRHRSAASGCGSAPGGEPEHQGPHRSDRTPISRLGQKRSPRESDRHCGHSGWRRGFGAGSGQYAALQPHSQGCARVGSRDGGLVFFDFMYDDHHIMDPRTRVLLEAPIASTLLRLAIPNMLVMLAQAAAGLVETYFIGKLGTDALAGVALVFPVVMLMQMMSAGAMGGGIASSIARALGGGRRADANALALHALVISLTLGAVFTVALVGGGRW